MEITAVIKAIEFIRDKHATITHLKIVSDSQYVTTLHSREKKLTGRQFITAKGNELPNADLLKKLYVLSALFAIEFIKVKAHQKTNGVINYNREADILCRQLVRSLVEKNS